MLLFYNIMAMTSHRHTHQNRLYSQSCTNFVDEFHGCQNGAFRVAQVPKPEVQCYVAMHPVQRKYWIKVMQTTRDWTKLTNSKRMFGPRENILAK